MKRLAFGVAVALLTFAAGAACAALWGQSGAAPFGLAQAPAATLAGLVCFALAASSERARRRGAESDIAYSLLLLCLGFFLTAAGLGMFLRVLIFD